MSCCPGADQHGGTIHAIITGPVSSKLFRDTYMSTSLQGDMLFAAILLKTPKLFEDAIYGNRMLKTGCSLWLLTAAEWRLLLVPPMPLPVPRSRVSLTEPQLTL